MWFVFRTKKEKELQEELERKDKKIEQIQATTQLHADEATQAIRDLNLLVEKHGIGGIIYFSTGKGRK